MSRKFQNSKLEIRKDVKRPYYFVRYSVPVIGQHGRKLERKAPKIGFCDEITKSEAMRVRAQILEDVNSGHFIVSSQMRFREVVKKYLELRVPQVGVATQRTYRSHIQNHLLPAFGDQRLCDINRLAVEVFFQGKEKAGLSWWSRKGIQSVLSSIFEAAKSWEFWSGENPAWVPLGRKRMVREKRLLTAEQLRAILAAVPERERFLITILIGLGLRISEALAVKWSDINWETGELSIQRRWYRGDLSEDGQTKTKTSKRTVQLGPLVNEFRKHYANMTSPAEFVFVGDDGVIPPDERDMLRYQVRPVLKRLNLHYAGFGWHAFRRQNITMRQNVGGANPMEAQKAAGHSSLDMTFLYTLTDPTRERAQVAAIYDLVVSAAQGKPQ